MTESKGRILVVDNEVSFLDLLTKILTNAGYEVQTATDGEKALQLVHETPPDLLLLDIMMPGMNGMDVKARLNEDEKTAGIPVFFLTGKHEMDIKVEGFNKGADDYVTKPFELTELLARIEGALKRRRFYEKLSTTDELTGLHNTHIYHKQLEALFNIARRYNRTFSLAVIDIDNLKTINDTLGHRAGDFAIRKTAEKMKQIFRKADIIVRYGGDEFIILFPESNAKQTEVAMNRLKGEIEGEAFSIDGIDEPLRISVSMGIADYSEDLKNEKDLFEAADRKMYEEKSRKRKSAKSIR